MLHSFALCIYNSIPSIPLMSICVKNFIGVDKFAQTTFTMFTTLLMPDTFLPPTVCCTVQCSPAQSSKVMAGYVKSILCKVQLMYSSFYVKSSPVQSSPVHVSHKVSSPMLTSLAGDQLQNCAKGPKKWWVNLLNFFLSPQRAKIFLELQSGQVSTW